MDATTDAIMDTTTDATMDTATDEMDDSRRKRLYAKAAEMSLRASRQMWKYLLMVLGVMVYIAYVVLANVFYSPSYRACMDTGGMLWSLTNAIVHAFFMVALVCYVARETIDINTVTDASFKAYLQVFDDHILQLVGVCVLILLFSYGILFFRCSDPIQCAGCTPAQQTAFNTRITTQVNRGTPYLKELERFYRENMQSTRTPISQCRNYYNSSFRQSGDNQITCSISADEKMPVCQASAYVTNSKDGQQTGPLLSQFFVMTSGSTCVIGDQYDSYMSPIMIKIALEAGARCLDFNITSYAHSKRSFPIVTTSRDYDMRNMQHNFVLFEDAMRMLAREWLKTGSATPRDPLFLRLNLNAGVTKECMDEIAFLLQFYLNEQNGNHLLPVHWNYKSVDADGGLGIYPLCAFFDSIVIMVNSPHRSLSPLLDGMVNVYTNPNYKGSKCYMLEWKRVKNGNAPERMEYNRTNLTYVETSFHPYNLVGHKRDPRATARKDVQPDDSLAALLMNKQSINNSALPAFVAGCQFVAMNFQNLDDDLKLYLSVFDHASFVLKPRSMWPTDMLTTPLPPSSGCNTDVEIAYNRKSVDGTACYEVCLPKPGTKHDDRTVTRSMYESIKSNLLNKNYQKLREESQSCRYNNQYQINSSRQGNEAVGNDMVLVRRRFDKKT